MVTRITQIVAATADEAGQAETEWCALPSTMEWRLTMLLKR